MKKYILLAASSLAAICFAATPVAAQTPAQPVPVSPDAIAHAAPPGVAVNAPFPGTMPKPTIAPWARVAVINFQSAVMQTNEGQRDFAALWKKTEPQQQALKAQADVIHALQQALPAGRDRDSAAKRKAQLAEIYRKKADYVRIAKAQQADFQQQIGETYQKLAEKVYRCASAYASSKDFDVLLDSSSTQQEPPTLLWAGEGRDITKTVVDLYNAQSGVPAPPKPVRTRSPHLPAVLPQMGNQVEHQSRSN